MLSSTPSTCEFVSAAAFQLDRWSPEWYEHVNARQLNMASCRSCVLGQMYGNYFSSEARRFRFHLLDTRPTLVDAFSPRGFIDNVALTRAWRREVRQRRRDTRHEVRSARDYARAS